MVSVNTYTSEEILEVFRANYRQQQQFDPEVVLGEELNFDTSVEEWRDICDLLESYKLANYFNYFFELDISQESWLSILLPEDERTLRDVCSFISQNAIKPLIKPLKLFGSDCKTAAIFKHLMYKFTQKGIDIKTIMPSSPLEPFAKKHLGVLIEEVNKLSPSALPPVEYKANVFYRIGTSLFVIGFLAMIISIWVSNLIWLIVFLFSLGILLCWVGSKFNPTRTAFKELDTFRSLVNRIEQNSNIYV